jgi:hypothetical protein
MNQPAKLAKVWLGGGLGSVAKRTHEKMLRWEFVDLAELRPKNSHERVPHEADMQKLVVLPGFEVAQARQKPISDIVMWMHCYTRYTAAMASKFPECTPGFMAHMVTVLKVYAEGWRMYDEAFREKMAATGCREWMSSSIKMCVQKGLRRFEHSILLCEYYSFSL